MSFAGVINTKNKRILITGAVLVGVAILGVASSYFFGNDNPVEQAVEAVIKTKTGMDLDLSPEPEKVQEISEHKP